MSDCIDNLDKELKEKELKVYPKTNRKAFLDYLNNAQ